MYKADLALAALRVLGPRSHPQVRQQRDANRQNAKKRPYLRRAGGGGHAGDGGEHGALVVDIHALVDLRCVCPGENG